MSIWLEAILEIIKITIPALIVFLTVYHLQKQFLEGQHRARMVDFRQDQQKTSLPLRLQAYERLSLFCERISIPAMILRVKSPNMTSTELKYALMIAVQHEFEHNITQQVYISDQLWQIVKIAKNDVINTVSLVAGSVEPDAASEQYASALYEHLETREFLPIDKALVAIKKEAGLLM
ncbi:MAG: hypothetical protein AB8G15_17650 [Saprospiraceae bacterium]